MPNRKILALDLGTKTGFAFGGSQTGLEEFGTWTLATPKEIAAAGKNRMRRRQDPRVVALYIKLRDDFGYPDIVIFEDVMFQTSRDQTQLWSSFRGAVWCAFPSALLGKSNIECVPTGTLKKFATGHGGATKEMMESALFKLRPDLKEARLDDNGVDAVWLWYWAVGHIKT